jgi:hypothetical protein
MIWNWVNNNKQQQAFLLSSPWRVPLLAERAYQGGGARFCHSSISPLLHNTHLLPVIPKLEFLDKNTHAKVSTRRLGINL